MKVLAYPGVECEVADWGITGSLDQVCVVQEYISPLMPGDVVKVDHGRITLVAQPSPDWLFELDVPIPGGVIPDGKGGVELDIVNTLDNNQWSAALLTAVVVAEDLAKHTEAIWVQQNGYNVEVRTSGRTWLDEWMQSNLSVAGYSIVRGPDRSIDWAAEVRMFGVGGPDREHVFRDAWNHWPGSRS